METRYLGRHKLVMEIPALTNEGDCFNLEGPRFAKGSIGQVAEILSQTAGRTRVTVNVVRGRILSRHQTSRLEKQADREEAEAHQAQLDRIPDDDVLPDWVPEDDAGGESWMDYDPRPRSGEDSHVAEEDPGGAFGVDDWATEDDGVKIMIKKNKDSEPEPFEPPPVPRRRHLSSGDRDFGSAKPTAPGVSELVAQVVGGAPPNRTKGAAFTQTEYAESMGLNIAREAVIMSGGRKSRVPSYKAIVEREK